MPIQEYIPLTPPGCALCCYGFERLERVADPALTHCTACGQPVRRWSAFFSVPQGFTPLLAQNL